MIILASASPRRRELLRGMGIESFEIRPSESEEPLDASMEPGAAVEKIALSKARGVERGPEDTVIAADTLVFLDGLPLGKPKDAQAAAGMLAALSGREHTVITGLAVLSPGLVQSEHVSTRVRFRRLSEEEIRWYVDSGEPMDKAGAYGIQGLGGMLVESIEGDYYNVVGLPVSRLALMLRRAGHDIFKLARKP